ncbi:MAG: M48 family metallopeptidase [Terriglobia bacterium]
MTLSEQQRSNRRKTLAVILVFIVLIAILGFGLDYYYLGYDPWAPPQDPRIVPFIPRPSRPYVTLIFLALAGYWSLWSLYGGDQAVLDSAMSMRVYPGTPHPQRKQLLQVVEELSIASGLPMPRVYVVADPDPNAFATGRDPAHASIAVTQGLLDRLSREELQAVIGHEMSHIRNFDVRLMTVIAALVGAAVLLSDWVQRSLRGGIGVAAEAQQGFLSHGWKGLTRFPLLLLWLGTAFLAPIIAQILAMAVSREREYLADAGSAELTRHPDALASALKKIAMEFAPTRVMKRGTAHLCIADPLGRKSGFREGFLADLLATHPPMANRISRLMRMPRADVERPLEA